MAALSVENGFIHCVFHLLASRSPRIRAEEQGVLVLEPLAGALDRPSDLEIEDLVVALGVFRVDVHFDVELLDVLDAVFVFQDGLFQRCFYLVLPDVDIGWHDEIDLPDLAAVGEVVAELVQLGADDQGDVLDDGFLNGTGQPLPFLPQQSFEAERYVVVVLHGWWFS